MKIDKSKYISIFADAYEDAAFKNIVKVDNALQYLANKHDNSTLEIKRYSAFTQFNLEVDPNFFVTATKESLRQINEAILAASYLLISKKHGKLFFYLPVSLCTPTLSSE